MIKLDAAWTTTVQETLGDNVISQSVTDTLFVTNVNIDFEARTLSAVIKRGTGNFTENLAQVHLVVNPDGTFYSTNDTWAGSVPGVPNLLDQLKATFDGFILASGLVTGTEI